jgi:hypothetical protein
MKSAVFLILLGSLLTIASCQQRPRERMPDEIIPASAEQSGTPDNDEEAYGAQNVIDMDFSTRAYTEADQDGNYWIRVNLGQVHCVRQFIELLEPGNHYQTWTCSDTLCTCEGRECSSASLTVSTVNSLPDNLPARTDCKYGDTVQFNYDQSNTYTEIAVVGEEVGCPAGQYKTNDGDCVNCGRNQYSSQGSDTCSNCPEGYGVEPGKGTSESDCRMERNSAESVAPAAILLMMSALAVY